jgi:hypothetical protein
LRTERKMVRKRTLPDLRGIHETSSSSRTRRLRGNDGLAEIGANQAAHSYVAQSRAVTMGLATKINTLPNL